MKRKSIWMVTFLFLLSACQNQTAVPPTATGEPSAVATAVVQVTATRESPTPTPTEKIEKTAEPEAGREPGWPLQVVNSEGKANVRSGPGALYPVVGSVKNNQQIIALGIDSSGQWVQFNLLSGSDEKAWLYAPFTNLSRSNQLPVVRDIPTPPVTVTPPPPRAWGEVKIIYEDGPVNVRLGPGTKYDLLGQVNPGDELKATGTIESAEWVQIQFAGTEDGVGWIYSEYCDYDRNLNTLPVIQNLPLTPTP